MPVPVVEAVAYSTTGEEVDVADGASSLEQPAGLTTGEFIFPFVGVESDGSTVAPFDDSTNKPTGCTLIDDFGDAGNVDVWAAGYYRQITGGETWPLPVAFVAGDAAVDFCGITLRVSGVNASNPINVVGTPITFLSVSDEIVPSVTTTENDCLGVALYIFDGADGSTISLHADSLAAGWGLAAQRVVNTGAVGLTMAVATKAQASFGALGDCWFVPSASDGGAGLMFAIKGAAGGGGPEALTALQGDFVYSGTDANLISDRIMEAESGAFSISGTDATLILNLGIDAQSGAFSISGEDADLLLDRLLTGQSGTFLIAGADANVSFGQSLQALVGSFSVTGADAGLLVDRLLQGVVGAFTLSGTNVNLTYSGVEAFPDIDGGVTVVSLTPGYGLTSLTPKYTIQ